METNVYADNPQARIRLYNRRLNALKTERSSWLAGWRDIADRIYPWLSWRLWDNPSRQTNTHIARLENSSPAWAVNVLAAGLSSGMTPQSRKWFKLGLPDNIEAKDSHDVKQWLHDAENEIYAALHRSNAYDVLPSLFLSLALFGTAALFIDTDEEDGVRFYSPVNGSYVMANSGRQSVNTFIRELRLSVAELVGKFGIESVSESVKNKYKAGNLDVLVDIVHVIEPNQKSNPDAVEAREAAPYRGVFYEVANTGPSAKFLREDGYYEMPMMAARWELFDGEVYGYGPGHKALGDCCDLQINMRTQSKLLMQLTSPPLSAPASLRSQGGVRLLPGEVTYYDPLTGGPQIAPIWTHNPNSLAALIAQEDSIKNRINRAFFVDIFLAISQEPTRTGVTATEIMERYQEKLLMLGPVLERVNKDLLDPMIKRVFWILYRAGRISEPPEEVAGQEMKIDYISAVALGQQATTVTAIQSVMGFVGTVAGAFPEALDLVDTDDAVRVFAGLHDLPPSVIRDQNTVEKIRADRAKQDEMMQQAAQGQQLAETAKTMSEASTDTNNLLSNTMDAMGYMTGMGL